MILVDSREKQFQKETTKTVKLNRNIKNYFDTNKIDYKIQKLQVGDYMSDLNPFLSIDHKLEFDELAMNILTNDSKRFKRELRLAKSLGIQLIFICENSQGMGRIRDVVAWKSSYCNTDGNKLLKNMLSLQRMYGCRFEFCKIDDTGRVILDLLERNKDT
ncbi:MAG: hypothetical protein R3Y09_06530 [Clostridia bacterium]